MYLESDDDKHHKYFDLRRSFSVSDLNNILFLLFFRYDIAYIKNLFLEIMDIKMLYGNSILYNIISISYFFCCVPILKKY